MNRIQSKNNIYKNGEYNPSYSFMIAQENARNVVPSQQQVKFRNDLREFCVQKGIVQGNFLASKTRNGIRKDIRALLTILRKNGLDEEFFTRNAEPQEGSTDGKV